MIGVAAVAAEVAALIADGEIQLQVATDDQPAADVVVVRREPGDDVDGLSQRARLLVVSISSDSPFAAPSAGPGASS